MRSRITGHFDVSLILPMVIGLIYAGTGGWTAERWNAALAIMGLGATAKVGFERGYNTYNPELRSPGPLRDEKGRFVANPDDR